MSSNDADILIAAALDVVPRALGLCDRDASSKTYGCCDRPYWHYRISDVADARRQEAGWLFALAASIEHPTSPFAGNAAMGRWSRASWRFWLGRRNRDGSCDEVYPRERSFCATSFGAAAFIETVMLLGGRASWQEELSQARSTFAWLAANANIEVANQMAASLVALSGYAALTDDPEIRKAADRRCEETLDLITADGVFPEYGGFDAGYQSITLSALARAATFSGTSARLQPVLERGVDRLAGYISVRGQADSSGTRGTQFIYPYALARLRSDLAARLATGLRANEALRPAWMDDRYCAPLACDYFLAGKELRDAHDNGTPDRL